MLTYTRLCIAMSAAMIGMVLLFLVKPRNSGLEVGAIGVLFFAFGGYLSLKRRLVDESKSNALKVAAALLTAGLLVSPFGFVLMSLVGAGLGMAAAFLIVGSVIAFLALFFSGLAAFYAGTVAKNAV